MNEEDEEEGEVIEPDTTVLDMEADNTEHPDFNIKPSLNDRFKPGKAKEIIRSILEEELKDKPYNSDESGPLVQKLSKIIKAKIEEISNMHYKIIVETTLIEQRGSGIRSDLKCVWDSDADSVASEVFTSEHLICHVSVFAIYCY